jgi:hypothetical protein
MPDPNNHPAFIRVNDVVINLDAIAYVTINKNGETATIHLRATDDASSTLKRLFVVKKSCMEKFLIFIEPFVLEDFSDS